jgi:methyl-accepting chemotaxis protein
VLDGHLQNAERRKLLDAVMGAKDRYHETFKELVNLIHKRNEVITGTLDRIGPQIAKNVEDVKLSVKAV